VIHAGGHRTDSLLIGDLRYSNLSFDVSPVTLEHGDPATSASDDSDRISVTAKRQIMTMLAVPVAPLFQTRDTRAPSHAGPDHCAKRKRFCATMQVVWVDFEPSRWRRGGSNSCRFLAAGGVSLLRSGAVLPSYRLNGIEPSYEHFALVRMTKTP
jgi:hypothetical protein